MNVAPGDPHVESLRYLLRPPETVKFDDAPPIEHETDAFRMRLESLIATFVMKKHHASAQTARPCVEEWLRAWELDVALRFGQVEIEFVFQNAKIIERDPPPPGAIHHASAHITLSVSAQATVTVLHRKYPTPPTNLKFSPDVDAMWYRYRGYDLGKEPLASMAYFCLSLFEVSAGGRAQAASQHSVSKSILNKLGEFTTNFGDPRTARKHSKASTGLEFTVEQTAWMKAAVKLLIRRKAEYDFGPAARLPQLNMTDLPTI